MSDAPARKATRQTNKVVIKGNLGDDPELRYTPTGTPVCTLRLGNSQIGPNQTPITNWVRVVIWGEAGKSAAEHLRKRREVTVSGRLSQRSYLDTSSPDARLVVQAGGKGIQRSTMEVVAEPGGVEWGFDPTFNAQQRAQAEAGDAPADPSATPDVPVEPPVEAPVAAGPADGDIPF